MKKLSAYTIAKNCSDLSDVNAGIEEALNYIHKAETENKPTQMAYIRLGKLSVLKTKLEAK